MNKQYCMDLAKILICPKTKKALHYDDSLKAFVNEEEHISYKIEEGIPILLEEEAEDLELD